MRICPVIAFILLLIPITVLAQTPLDEITALNGPSVQQVGIIPSPSTLQMLDLAWSPDGASLAMTTDTGLTLFDFEDGGMREGMHYGTTSVRCVAWSPDKKLLAACNSHDGIVFIWNVATGEQAAAIYTGKYVSEGIAFSPDGKLLAVDTNSSDNKRVVLWGVLANGQRQTLTAANAYRIQKLATFEHTSVVHDIDFNADGSLLATITVDDTLRVWDTLTDEVVMTRQLEEAYTLDFSDDYLAVSISDSDIMVMDAVTFEDVITLTNPDDLSICDLDFSPNGEVIAVATYQGLVQLWSLEGELLATLDEHPVVAWRLTFNPAGTILASLGWNDRVRLWGHGAEVQIIHPPTPTPVPTATMTPVPTLGVGGNALVRTTGGDALNMRSSPSRQAERIAQLKNGTPIVIMDGPQAGDGLVWWQVRTEDGLEGWIVEAVDGEQTLIPK